MYVVHTIRRTKLSTGEFVRRSAPEFCQVSVVHEGKKVVGDEKLDSSQKPPHSGRGLCLFKWAWACFPGEFILHILIL